VEEFFDRLVEIQGERWHSRQMPGVLATTGVLKFHRSALHRLAASGQVRLFELGIGK
jgi:CelD/BcsL family acetyltransferase involved in cellulose biosynthesis